MYTNISITIPTKFTVCVEYTKDLLFTSKKRPQNVVMWFHFSKLKNDCQNMWTVREFRIDKLKNNEESETTKIIDEECAFRAYVASRYHSDYPKVNGKILYFTDHDGGFFASCDQDRKDNTFIFTDGKDFCDIIEEYKKNVTCGGLSVIAHVSQQTIEKLYGIEDNK